MTVTLCHNKTDFLKLSAMPYLIERFTVINRIINHCKYILLVHVVFNLLTYCLFDFVTYTNIVASVYYVKDLKNLTTSLNTERCIGIKNWSCIYFVVLRSPSSSFFTSPVYQHDSLPPQKVSIYHISNGVVFTRGNIFFVFCNNS